RGGPLGEGTFDLALGKCAQAPRRTRARAQQRHPTFRKLSDERASVKRGATVWLSTRYLFGGIGEIAFRRDQGRRASGIHELSRAPRIRRPAPAKVGPATQ